MKRSMTTILLFVVLFVGLALLLYPSVSDFYNSFHQSRAVATYNTAVEQESKKDYEADWAAANAYNEKLRAQSTVDRLIMTDEEREAKGINHSILHVDFMVGSDDMSIRGQKQDGTWEDVFVNGRWAW